MRRLAAWWRSLHEPRCRNCGSTEWDVRRYVYVCAGCRVRWPVQPDAGWADRADAWLYRYRILLGIAAVVFVVVAAAVLARPGPG